MIDKSRIKAIVIDFDATLADTADQILLAKMTALDTVCVDRPDPEDLATFSGMNIRNSFILTSNIPSDLILDEVVELYHNILASLSIDRLLLFDGAVEFLKLLKSRGIKTGVSSLRRNADLTSVIRHHSLDRLIDSWIGDDAVENPKPAPDMVLTLIEQFGVEPEETIVIGDTLDDIDMGQLAGCPTIAFTAGVQSESVLRIGNPDMTVASFHELASAII